MTQWNDAPLDEIRGLVDERARYEGWITALDGRRDAVPAHVLERVRQDYRGRVARVVESLSTHAGVLREGVQALETRDDELQRSIREREDVLAEVELRALVGEYDASEAGRRRDEVQGALAALRGEAERGGAKLAELRGLLESAAGPEPESHRAPIETQPLSDGHDAGVRTASPTPRPGEDAGAAVDDAFLRPNTPTIPTMAQQRAPFGDARDPFAVPGFGSTPTQGAPTVPGFGADPLPTTAGQPQEKTLRCPDCSAMNYATEWYCERCGGELAAL